MKPKRGEIVAWSDSTYRYTDHKEMIATTVIAIANSEDYFMVALNYYEEGRLWTDDDFPEGAKLRKADTIEAGFLLAKLMELGYHLIIKDGVVCACGRDFDDIEDLSASASRSWLFNQYINALIRHYNISGSLHGMSKIRDKHRCTGITKAQFYELKLNELDALRSYYPQDYTDAIYDWVTGKSNKKPMIGQ